MASNQVHAYRVARDAAKNAKDAGASDETIRVLDAAAAAAKTLTPGGKGGGGILS